MEIIDNPARGQWASLCRRNLPTDDAQLTASVEAIVKDVARRGDEALREYAERFDGVKLSSMLIPVSKLQGLAAKVAPEVQEAIKAAAANIAKFHRAQLMEPVEVETVEGVRCVQRQVPIRRVGLYIPGGRAPLFSTVLMLAVPAKIAGCREVILCTPCREEGVIAPEIAFCALHCGIDKVYQVGGAQAVAAMAYGTESIPRVDKIFGPGNRFVTKAKQLVTSVTAIDMPAGPSEVMVMADSTANAEFVASDLLSQAEHGPDSQAILVTDTREMARAVYEAVERQRRQLKRQDSVEGSLSASRLIVLACRDDMVDFANEYASEHLIISMTRPWEVAERIEAAGSVFIGNYSPESAGDYASGTNHTLPTSGWASAYSGVNIDSFMKKITYQELTADGLARLAPTITAMATAEGLDAHARAVEVRIGNNS